MNLGKFHRRKLCNVLILAVLLCASTLSCGRDASLSRSGEVAFEELPITKMPPIPPYHGTQLIVIDPGHGGKDFGSEAARVVTEKELNLKTAKIVVAYLRQMGFQVVMTRDEDRFVPLAMRTRLANNQRADLFLSIHYNSAPSPAAEGIEIFYYRSDMQRPRMHASKQLAQKVLQTLKAETGAKSRGVKEGNLAVIRETTMPAILIECGFLTNPKECERIKQASYMKKVARGIAMGVRDFIMPHKS